MPGYLAIGTVSADQDLRMIAPPVGRHLNTILHVTERSRRFPLMNIRTHPSRLLHEVMVEPITHAHIGDRIRRFDEDSIPTSIRKLNAEHRVFDDGLECRVQKLLNPDRQPAAAVLITRMDVVIDVENGQAGTANFVGCSSPGWPQSDS